MNNKKIVLITGASSGIGFDTAQTLAQQGHKVYAAARRVERMEPLKAFGVQVLKMDVTNEMSMIQGVEAVIQAEGRIDVLVNNAGMGIGGPLEFATEEEIRLQMDTNFMGLVHCVDAVLPQMRKQGSGKIIALSSIGA